MRPPNAGILMFGLDPQLPLPQSEVVCIKYADPLGVRRYIDRKNFRGTLPELIDQASRFIAQYIRMGATIRGFYREDEPEYPQEALREAVVNAVVHRDYSRIGETVRVFMFPDRVEVRSPGGLPPELTVDDLLGLRTASVPRNPVMAGFLRDIPGYMERVGSGIRFMITEMREAGLPDPEFSDHVDFTVTLLRERAEQQWLLAAAVCEAMAATYLEWGFDFALSAFRPPGQWRGCWERLDALAPLIIVLLPEPEVLLARDAQREGRSQVGEASVRRGLAYDWEAWRADPRAFVIDNTSLSVAQVVALVEEELLRRSAGMRL